MKYIFNKYYKECIYFGSRGIGILIFLMFYIWKKRVSFDEINFVNYLTYTLNQFDSKMYLVISELGYNTNKFEHIINKEALYAFFPLYPLLLRAIHFVFRIPYMYLGVIVNIVLSYLSCFILNYLVEDKNKKIVLLVFCFSPISYYLIINHTESLYLFLTLLCWYFFKKNKFLLSGFALGLSMLTRNTGYIFALSFFVYYIFNFKKNKIKNIISFFTPAAIVGSLYPLYLFQEKGNALYFISVQTYYYKVKAFVFDTLFFDLKKLYYPYVNEHTKFVIILTFVFFACCLFLGIKHMKIEPILCIYLILGCIYPLFTRVSSLSLQSRSTKSLFRYMLGLCSFYLLFPSISKNKIWRGIYTIVIFILYFIVMWSNFNLKIID